VKAAAVILASLVLAPAAAAADPDVAALQVALRARGLYAGTIDGVLGPGTTAAVVKLQRRARIAVDGVPGPQTRGALGRLGRPELGARQLRRGRRGWDVAELQFRLAQQGFPSGAFDGIFGWRVDTAVRRFQGRWGLRADGVVGPATLVALQGPPPTSPLLLSWPLDVPATDGFGPRGDRFHTGLDFPAPTGLPVAAAAAGVVTYAAWHDGGWGNLVAIRHGSGVRTLYAHLSTVAVRVGQRVAAGAVVGAVGATGRSFGSHLHFEVRVRGGAVDPVRSLPRR
jgi:murein DD-endopeptidase MepM/ murein hydrolase activator NlpD